MPALSGNTDSRDTTTNEASWLTFSSVFLVAVVAFGVLHEGRLTTSYIVVPAAVAMLVGFVHDRFFARLEAGGLIGLILIVVAFAGGAVTGLLLPT